MSVLIEVLDSDLLPQFTRNAAVTDSFVLKNETIMQKLTKRDLLNRHLLKLLKPYHGNWCVEWRTGEGWYAVPDELRHFNDEGEFLGKDFDEAIEALRSLF